ncbi:hypothetical protein CKJ55_24990 [Mycobacterium avium]|uniref:hypothetical protein n=1 Tax=Mycobacterium avium TaxID=1764 RepID=UPI0004460E8D|nr:hypothetical protein [Mycobacterium avium]ETZ55270.1 hypothetical protein L838_0926 [Mycobacterium avium MAV_120709_2344]MCA4741565.1 hypothetical protein [Mycobacterium avium subsp. hominissuis]MCA4746213.1 hypothetical protein [Mycobacterium avium subsp. hominissuis]MCA4766625.1 hypothetical protein [Mycobacterium avium subsp. hominissuis]MDO2387061.1 hypothetical protein [Mycobacterium avium subsp. hominissuis]
MRWQCETHVSLFTEAENIVAAQLNRDNPRIWAPDTRGDDQVHTVLKWCHTCPIRTTCLSEMMTLNYTGIAGGEILNNGTPLPRPEQ